MTITGSHELLAGNIILVIDIDAIPNPSILLKHMRTGWQTTFNQSNMSY